MVKNINPARTVPLQTQKMAFVIVKFALYRVKMSTNERSYRNVRWKDTETRPLLTKLVKTEILLSLTL